MNIMASLSVLQLNEISNLIIPGKPVKGFGRLVSQPVQFRIITILSAYLD
jgi:hypothetical protein